MTKPPPELENRARTALGRVAFSRPMQRALEDGLVREDTEVFDFGCGRGGDLDRLARLGYVCSGWDPVHRPDGVLTRAPVVNLGYVVNVIEDAVERKEVLQQAFNLSGEVLVVSARLVSEARDLVAETELDGVRTAIGTFQKFFRQEELRDWIDATLDVVCIAAAPGIFYVFKDVVAEQRYLANRIRRAPRLAPVSRLLFDANEESLSALISFYSSRGRLPRSAELAEEASLRTAFGSVRNAWATVRRVMGDEPWDRVRDERSSDLLVFLALSHLARRPPRPSELPDELRLDVRDLFGSHKQALEQARRLLAETGNPDRLRLAGKTSVVGKCLPQALYVHVDAVAELVPSLRVIDGLARALVGEVPETTLVKFHLDRPAVSYLAYPEFDDDPHPALASGYVIKLDELRVEHRDYSGHANPAILHRKELFLSEDDPRRQRFSGLTRQEERAGLYKRPSTIGLRRGWEDTLAAAGYRHTGHRLVRVRQQT